MSTQSFKVKSGLTLTPTDLTSLTNPQAGDLACDINDSNKIKRYDADSASWTEVGSGAAGDVDTLLVQDFDSASLSSFTQTGLELVTTNQLDGRQSARLVHQAASTRSFKQTLAVPPKFRGVNMTASLTLRSSSAQGNVTIQFRDETNSVDYPSQQLQTNSQIIASLVTNSTTLVSGFSNSNINSLKVGMTVTGSGIPTGTTIASINSTALTITLSQAATASATVSLSFSDLPRTIQLGFNIPANCLSYSYTISALQEAGSPETYVDDIVLKNYWLGMSNQGQSTATLQVPIETDWQSTNFSTLAWQGLGTVTVTESQFKRQGSDLLWRFKGVIGTVTGSEAQILLPLWNGSQLAISGSPKVTSRQILGSLVRGTNFSTDNFFVITSGGVNYLQIGRDTTTSSSITTAPQTGTATFSSGEAFNFNVRIPIEGWEVTESKSFVTTDLVPAKAVLGNTSLSIPSLTGWQGYTPTFQGFGSPTNVEFEWRRVGENVEIRGKFTSGTVTAVEARVGLPAGLTSAGSGIVPSIQIAGTYHSRVIDSGNVPNIENVYIETSVSYVTFQRQGVSAITKALGTQMATSSADYLLTASVPCAGLSVTEEVVVSGTQSALVANPDSSIRLDTANGYGSTNTAIPRFSNLRESYGSDVTYQDSATLGASFTINTTGVYSISYSASFSGSAHLGLSKNSSQLTTAIQNITAADRLIIECTDTTDRPGSVSWTGLLNAGDVIRPHNQILSFSTAANTSFTITKEGSLKQLNVSSDQKITIPTSELRMEGASTRGSTATAIVRFDNVAKLRGDAFSVVSDAVNGTAITMLKAGLLDISTALNLTIAGTGPQITLNQSVLTGLSTVSSEILADQKAGTSSGVQTTMWSGFVKVGDVLRVAMVSVPSASTSNFLNLVLQEQQVQVSVTNTLPQFSESDSSVRVDTANGYGSTATKIRRFSNVRDNIGTDIEYVDSATDGASFKVRSSGVYNISYTDQFGIATRFFGISKNASSLTTDFTSLTVSERLATGTNTNVSFPDTVSWQGYLQAGDVIRAHSEGTSGGTADRTSFTISKVGKPNVTGVNVTPFVNVPQVEAQSSYLFTASSFSASATITGTLTRTNGVNTIYSYNSSTGVYTMLKKARITASYSNISAGAGAVAAIIKVNGAYVNYDGSSNNTNFPASASYSNILNVGDALSFAVEANAGINHYISVLAQAESDSIITANESFSTDTASLTYAGSGTYTLATLANAPVGTYITFTYAASTNTRTQTTTRPTQTDADMNANGILLYTRAYNAASTAAQPAAIAIQIGKGLKGRTLDLYKSAGKILAGSLDYTAVGTDTIYGVMLKEYNELTGILLVDFGLTHSSATISRALFFSDISSSTNGYLVINASKNPALTGVPLLQPRIATLSDVKASGTAGGSSTAATTQTRTLNTISDPTGIVTSLTSNQFVLPAGEYYIEAQAPAYNTGLHQIRIRNITDSTTPLVGTSEYAESVSNVQTPSRISGNIVLASSKTFELQHYTQLTQATSGLGRAASSGFGEVYSIVKITKVK